MRGFTFLELVIVLIVIGILATLGITQYGSYRERSLGREAVAHLKLIAAAEKVYRLEMGHYYPDDGLVENDVNNINDYLKLSLSDRNWNASITDDSAGDDGTSFVASAIRGDCTYTIDDKDLDGEPNAGANCP